MLTNIIGFLLLFLALVYIVGRSYLSSRSILQVHKSEPPRLSRDNQKTTVLERALAILGPAILISAIVFSVLLYLKEEGKIVF